MSLPEKRPLPPPKAIDLSHHLSDLAIARNKSPLKTLQKYVGKPGMISLAGGMPDPSYFPFASISAEVLESSSFDTSGSSHSSMFGWLWNMFGNSEKTEHFTVPKYASRKGDIDLSTTLQYSPATGSPVLANFIREFTELAYTPAYCDWQTLVHIGNTDGIARCIRTFCNPGECILIEEWSYPSTFATIRPLDVKILGVKVDGQGMSAVDLESILSTWDEKERGAKRPHVMYTIPTGQNPTGATMGEERKQAIYNICVRYDILIIDDDPYYFLQEGLYVPKKDRARQKTSSGKSGADAGVKFLRSLVPSYLKFDYQGRVIRLDSFSKIIAPGSRMGWFTCNPLFAERLERDGEVDTQAPSGFSQALITQLISNHWGLARFIQWLQGLQSQYIIRRDFFVDCIFDTFDVQPATPELASFGAGLPVLTAYAKSGNQQMTEKSLHKKMSLFSFVPPSSGMFVWLKFHVKGVVLDEGETVGQQLFIDLANNGLLVAPGEPFSAEAIVTDDAMFRIAFSMGTEENLRKGVEILEKTLRQYITT